MAALARGFDLTESTPATVDRIRADRTAGRTRLTTAERKRALQAPQEQVTSWGAYASNFLAVPRERA